MPSMTPEERDLLVELIAQAVIDKIDERERVNRIADLVIARVLEIQAAESAQTKEGVEPPHGIE